MAERSSSIVAGADGTSAAVPVPAGAAVGDIVSVGLYKENTNAVTPPAGFTQKVALTTSVNSQGTLYVFWKRLTAADSGSYSFSWSGRVFREATAVCNSGRVATGDPFDGTPGTVETNSANSVSPSTAPAAAGGDAVGFATNFNGGVDFSTSSPGYVKQQDGDVSAAFTADNLGAGATTPTFSANITNGMKAFLGVLAAAGGSGATGTGTATAPAATSTGTGTVLTHGTGNPTAPPSTSSGSASVTVSGTGTPTAPPPTAAGTGAVLVNGAGTLAAPTASLSGTGTVGTTPVTGSGTATAPAATIAGTGAVTVTGSGQATAPIATVTGTGAIGAVPVTGTGTATAPRATASGAGTVRVTGTGQAVAPQPTTTGSGRVLVDGSGAIVAPGVRIDGSGAAIVTGSGMAVASAATTDGAGFHPDSFQIAAEPLLAMHVPHARLDLSTAGADLTVSLPGGDATANIPEAAMEAT